MKKKKVMITIDVEEWFTNGRTIKINDWHGYESRAEKNIEDILEILEKYQLHGTFFVLGWLAKKKPSLVKRIHGRGHEIASHGYGHELVYYLRREQFREDIRSSKQILEDLIGQELYGYRAPCFSITEWALSILKEEGFVYDSSVSPNSIFKGSGKRIVKSGGGSCYCLPNGLYEFEIPSIKLLAFSIPWGGGGYFRLYPFMMYKYGLQFIKGDPFVFYLHPYDVDKLRHGNFSIRRSIGAKHTLQKLEQLAAISESISIKEYLAVKGVLP